MSDELSSVFTREAGRCTASLVRVLGDLDLAEDAVAEAFAIASERWPVEGTPPNPGGWILTTPRNRAIDRLRRESTRTARYVAAYRLADTRPTPEDPLADVDPLAEVDALADVVPDDQLRLLFLCCHPSLNIDAQVALTLRLVAGLDVEQIAEAFLTPRDTMSKRIGRAKRKLRDNRAPYRIPRQAELPDRLGAVLAAVYLTFTMGHRPPPRGDANNHADLGAEAIRLGTVLLELMPDEPEVAGLLALMLLTDARRDARTDDEGALVRLSEQDRSLWDRDQITRGHELVRACLRRNQPGTYQVQAAIAAVHADAASHATTDWHQICALYDQLYALRPTEVVALNRAVARAELHGAQQVPDELSELAGVLDDYQPFHAVLADLASRAGEVERAHRAYDRALELTTDAAERAFLLHGQRRTAAPDSIGRDTTR